MITTLSQITPTSLDWPALFCSTISEVEEALTDRAFIHSHIVRACRRMLLSNRSSEMCLEIFCSENENSIWMTIRLEEAAATLSKILQHRLDSEEYEECREIDDLIREVEVRQILSVRTGPEPPTEEKKKEE